MNNEGMSINEKTIAIWFLPTTEKQDFLGTLYRNDEGKLQFTYRFRYYDESDKSPWSGKDEKHWYDLVAKDENKSEDEMFRDLKKMIEKLEILSGNKADEILMKGKTVEQFMDEMASKPWAHMRVIPQDGQKRNWNIDKKGAA